MRGGTLDERIALQRKTTSQSDSGEPIEVWSNIDANRPASITGVLGSELIGSDQIKARQQMEFRIRWSTNVADLSPLDRVIYPISALTDSPSVAREVFDILAVNPIGRHEVLQIIAARNPDVSAS